MILSIGEILADMIGSSADAPRFEMHCGGAPFNVAVNCKKAGARTGFIGRVGNDLIGKFLQEYASRAALDDLQIQVDPQRNTTLAFVTLTGGERAFSFFRHHTADYHLQAESIDLSAFPDLHILHLGSLMLSESEGRFFAAEMAKQAKAKNIYLSFDVNFRMDLYRDTAQAVKAYAPFVEQADILKFSADELLDYTGDRELETALARLRRPDRLLLVTLGRAGSLYAYNGQCRTIPSAEVTPIDTTGAGDAFFGTLLAGLDGQNLRCLDIPHLETAIAAANAAGARTTQFYGAIQL